MNAFSVTVEPDEVIRVAVTGDWSIRRGLPALTAIRQSLMQSSKVRQITIDAVNLLKWDSALLASLFSVEAICRSTVLKLILETSLRMQAAFCSWHCQISDPSPHNMRTVSESNQVTFGCYDSRDRQCGTWRAYGVPRPACGALDGRTGARKFVLLCAYKEPPHELGKRWYDALLPRRGTVFCFVTSAWH